MKHLPITALVLSIITAVFSLAVAHMATGSVLGKVTMIQLKSYGGLNVSDLLNWEL